MLVDRVRKYPRTAVYLCVMVTLTFLLQLGQVLGWF